MIDLPVNLTELVQKFSLQILTSTAKENTGNINVKGISQNTDSVEAGYIFVALRGAHTHGANFSIKMIEKGAVALMLDVKEQEVINQLLKEKEITVPLLIVENLSQKIGEISSYIYGNPSEKLKVVGITGTAGKTSTTTIIFDLLQKTGKRVGLIGSNSIKINDEVIDAKLTTPQATDLQKLFHEMVLKKVTHVVMEVSSHAIVQGRINGTNFELVAFTNLSQDHLDFHKTMENYYQAKRELFINTEQFSVNNRIICTFDQWGKRLVSELTGKFYTLAKNDKSCDWEITNEILESSGSTFTLVNEKQKTRTIKNIKTNLVGDFNVKNIALALVALELLHIPIEDSIRNTLQNLLIVGRMQQVDKGQDFRIIVDYAHKPGSLQQVLESLAKQADGKIITVLGAGGDRDRTKRPLMGRIAAQYSQVLIVTDDNPRYEDAAEIREQIISGIKQKLNKTEEFVLLNIANREEAIHKSLNLAASQKNSIVLIAGKGHETGQYIRGQIIPFSDVNVVENYLSKLGW